MFDVLVIGGGVIGGCVLRELSKYSLSVCMIEKESDVAMGASRANSGIVHAGFDAKVGSLKAKFNVLGHAMMEDYTKELGVKFERNGSLVVAFSKEELNALYELKERGKKNGVQKLRILNKEELKEIEPNLSNNAVGALYAPTAGIVCPYKLAIATIGNAMDNGAKLVLDFECESITKNGDFFSVKSKDDREIFSRIIINCAGLGAQKIANMAGDFSFQVKARRGEYLLLDKNQSGFVKRTLFFAPTEKGKGILVSPTVDGNIILGPTADEVEENFTDTTTFGLSQIQDKAKVMTPNLKLSEVITSFAGARAYCDRHDFIVEESTVVRGLINCAGIESPGLTSAPAIAKYVVEDLVLKDVEGVKKEDFNPTRRPDDFFAKLDVDDKNEIIKREPSYGRIVCRCEKITEGEIVRAIKVNPKATTIDGVKRRVRAGMGRCQCGFCQPQIMEIIARENNLSVFDINKGSKGSYIVKEITK